MDFSEATFAKQKGALKKGPGPQNKPPAHDPAAIEAMKTMYGKHKGDLGTLAKATGSSEKLLKAKPPKDAGDFATNLLNGAYSQE